MNDVALEMNRVYKKFKKGELYDSLRDLIPALTKNVLKQRKNGTLEKREFWALNDVSFTVNRGDAFGIIGRNGAGKSTILKLLTGIMRPNDGSITVNGSLSALIEVGAGFHPDLTGRENIFLNGTILGMKRDQIKKKFDEIVEFSGLEEFIDTPVKRYSTGMYARLGFSVAAHVNPNILVVDEVLSVGDYTFQKKCLEKMNSIIQGGATVIFVSHNLKAVADLCGRSLYLQRGRVVKIGPTTEVIRAYLSQPMSDKGNQGQQKEVYVSNVGVRNQTQECFSFESGQKASIDIEVTATQKAKDLTVILELKNDRDQEIFNVNTQRLGCGTFNIEPGERYSITYDLDLHLVPGNYHVGVLVYRAGITKIYDQCFPAATIFISSEQDLKGAANLYPKVKMEKLGLEKTLA